MKRRGLWMVALAAAALAGCAGPPPAAPPTDPATWGDAGPPSPPGGGPPPDPAPDGPAPVAPAPVWNNLTACTEVVAFRLLEFDHANGLLPAGYAAGDASGFLGLPAPVGKGLVILGVFHCAAYGLGPGPLDWAGLVIYLETPRVPGLELDPAYADLYLLAHHSDQADAAQALVGLGVPAETMDVDAELGPAAGAAASSRDEAGDAFALGVAGGAPSEFHIVVRFWNQNERGIALLEFRRDPTTFLASAVTSCTLRSGSVFERAFGSASCGADAMGAIWPDPTGFVSRYRLEPGLTVEGG